jgi:muramoyltetrapeptide carboxypeptidase
LFYNHSTVKPNTHDSTRQFTKGDTIAILATARKNIDDNLRPAIDLLHSWGLEVIIGNTIGLDNNQLAGTDAQRAADFQQQLDNPNIKAIWCKRRLWYGSNY